LIIKDKANDFVSNWMVISIKDGQDEQNFHPKFEFHRKKVAHQNVKSLRRIQRTFDWVYELLVPRFFMSRVLSIVRI